MNFYKAPPASRQRIRGLARIVRRACGYENTPYFPIIHFLEIDLTQIIPDFELEVIAHKDMKNKCGETKPFEHRILLNETIYSKAISGDGFARLTVAHEIGHLLMHGVDSHSLRKVKSSEHLKTFEDPEWQADVFGGELLAPHYLIDELTIDEIAKFCGVTKRAATIQKIKS